MYSVIMKDTAPVTVPYQHWILRCPLWFPFILAAAYPTIAFIRGPWRRYRRRKRGLCLSCAYNLEGNQTGTCPECGVKA